MHTRMTICAANITGQGPLKSSVRLIKNIAVFIATENLSGEKVLQRHICFSAAQCDRRSTENLVYYTGGSTIKQ